MAAPAPVYKLRSMLQGHSMDVKHVSVVQEPSGALLTASRDKTARLWYQHEDSSHSVRKIYKGHSKYVSCSVYQEPSEEFPSGLIYTGCQDGKIRAFLPDIEDPLYQLEGHAENVTSLFVGKFGTIISGSWDCTAKVWVNRKCSMTLSGHSFAVWAVAILPEVGIMVTASADKAIKLWKAGVCTHTLAGHTDAVRSLAVISKSEFLSAGNDASVRRWSSSGECLGTYYGHDNYIYSISLLSGGGWVTSGEDRSVRVWRDNAVIQTIYLPAISVWSVAVLANEDIAAATNDGCVRIFSRDPARQASKEIQAIFEEELSKVALAAQQELGGVKLTDLPGAEALYEPGAKDGQQKMVRSGDAVSVHSWNMAEQKWDKIGDVVGAAGGSTETSGKKLYMGKEYDFVFDIEIDEPKSTLKLPYNTTDSPYMAAQEFIHKNDLSQYYLEEIAGHIITHTGGQKLGAETGGNIDPLTGGSSYHAGAIQGDGSGSGPAEGGAFDPFTGSGAYTSGSGGVETGQGARIPEPDPWMQGAYRTEESMDTGTEVKNSYFPLNEFLQFNSQVKAEAMVNKLKEFNSQVSAELQLDPSLLEQLPSLATSPTPDSALPAALNTLLTWPDAQVFPALDLLRASLLNPASQAILIEKSSLDQIFSSCLKHVDKTSPPPCQMLALRALTNLFSCQQGEDLLRTYRESVVARVFEQLFPIVGDNKNIQIAAATLLLNYSVSLTKKFDDETQVQLLSALSINFLTFITDWEARFRTVVAIGTLLTTSPEAVEYAKTLETKDAVRGWRLLEGPAKVSECAQFIENML
eukprot:GFUD01040702.1.p1 GENE.GFUD01040702.1~~GFUD01040702.1.p1  ORF type:complete len:806 (-),score=248.04 GFUD01040702.1:260-2677(-)